MIGPGIMPLPQDTEYNSLEISNYISIALQLINTQDAYGIFAGVRHHRSGPVVPTLIFGIPRSTQVVQFVLPPTPNNLPIWVMEDRVLPTNELERAWEHSKVKDKERLELNGCSVGVESIQLLLLKLFTVFESISNYRAGSMTTAGSIGGYLKHSPVPTQFQRFGLTAAHCISNPLTGISVCSPSTIEVTSRLKMLIRYTDLCPTDPIDPNNKRLHFVSARNSEASGLVNRYRFHESSSGVTLLRNGDEEKTGVFSGGNVGVIVASHFGSHTDLLHQYDQELRRRHLPHFSASVSYLTRIDWSIFTVNPDR